MEKGDNKVSILLDGGLADRRAPQLRAPLATQFGTPQLARSDNTRLSVVRGSAVRAPLVTQIAGSLPSVCHGILPAGTGKASALFFRGGNLRGVYAFGSVLTLRTQFGGFVRSLLPSRVGPTINSGFQACSSLPCVQVDEATGRVWRATILTTGLEIDTSVTESDGTIASPPRATILASAGSRWLSLTAHGANIMCVWSVEAGSLVYYRLTYASGSVSATGLTTVITPASGLVWFDVKRFDDTHAVIITGHPAVNTTTRVIKVNINTGAIVNTLDIAGAGTAFEHAVAVETVAGVVRVAVTVASTTALTVRTYLLDSALAIVWGPITHAVAVAVTRIAIGLQSLPNSFGDGVTVAYEVASTAFSSMAGAGITCLLLFHDMATGALVLGKVFEWKRLASKGTQVKWSATEFAPAFLFHTAFSPSTTTAADADYVDDPALEVWMANSYYSDDQGAVARLGPVRGSFRSFDGSYAPDRPSSSAVAVNGSDMWIDYRSIVTLYSAGGTVPHFSLQSAKVELSPAPLFTVSDRDGVGTLAGGVPLQFDGAEVVEAGSPLSRPHVAVQTNGGGSWAAGTYFFVAIYVWTDLSGKRHRSRPSNVATWVSPGASDPGIFVSAPRGFTRTERANANNIMWEVYATPLNQPTFHLLTGTSSASSSPFQFLGAPPVPVSSSAILYSTGAFGQELLPQPPPPLRDVAVIGARMWGIDAEFPYRLVYTKLLVGGVGYEFNPALEITVPPVGGQAQRVFDVAGTVVVLCERAVWQISGFGPDNTGQGGSFSPAIKLSDYGCDQPRAASVFPGGVIWANKDRWYVMLGGAVQQIQDVKVGMTVTCAALYADQDEIAFFGTQTAFDPGDAFGPAISKVYNYVLNRWSRHNALAYTHVCGVPYETRRVYGFENGVLYAIDTAGLADSAPMVFETDWLNLAGDLQDHVVLRDFIIEGQRVSAHTVTIEVFTDHNLTATTTHTWTDANITDVMARASSAPWYSLRKEAVQQDTRSVKVRLTFGVTGTGEGARPLALSVVFRPAAPLREESFPQGSYVSVS
jgi:hypothetical protein